jgi:hypothetical protein
MCLYHLEGEVTSLSGADKREVRDNKGEVVRVWGEVKIFL